jgi:hypothetical protein
LAPTVEIDVAYFFDAPVRFLDVRRNPIESVESLLILRDKIHRTPATRNGIARPENVSVEDLRQILAEVDKADAAKRIIDAITPQRGNFIYSVG